MLVDGMVAVLIVAIGLVALAFMYTQGIKTRVGGERRQAAVQIAGQGMEKLKKADSKTLADLQDIGLLPSSLPYTLVCRYCKSG